MGLPLNSFLFADLYCHVGKALLCVEIKKALENMVDEFGKDVIVDTLKKYDERIIFPFLTVKKLAQIIIALSLFSKKNENR